MQDQGGLSKSTITHPGLRPVYDLTTQKGTMTLSPQAANSMQYTSKTRKGSKSRKTLEKWLRDPCPGDRYNFHSSQESLSFL